MKPPLLLLTHRMPYPPDKGDKLRAYHLLRHLTEHHRVFLGSFIDDAHDAQHVPALAALCAGLHLARLHPRLARWKSLAALSRGEPLTLAYFRNRALDRWVGDTLAAEEIHTAVVFCSAMAQYVIHRPGLRRVVDFVDVDSAKWAQYAKRRRGPLAWVYQREAARLARFEAACAMQSCAAFFVTDAERALFLQHSPQAASRTHTLGNGVDAATFSPHQALPSPYAEDEQALVFTGVMDYWPNEDAATWFAREVMPQLALQPKLKFYIVGMRPSAAVRALAGPRVVVTGRVPDVRPYLAHAALAVAPLRVARGVQNKVLEAMAMARAVVATPACASALALPDEALCVASDAPDFARSIAALLHDAPARARMGAAARAAVLRQYSWPREMARIDPYLPGGAA